MRRKHRQSLSLSFFLSLFLSLSLSPSLSLSLSLSRSRCPLALLWHTSGTVSFGSGRFPSSDRSSRSPSELLFEKTFELDRIPGFHHGLLQFPSGTSVDAIKTLWPSGLRRWTQVPLSSVAWVRTPQVSLHFNDCSGAPLASQQILAMTQPATFNTPGVCRTTHCRDRNSKHGGAPCPRSAE